MASQRRLTSTDDIELRVVVKFCSGPKLSPVSVITQFRELINRPSYKAVRCIDQGEGVNNSTCQGEGVNSSTFQGEGVNSSTCQGEGVNSSTCQGEGVNSSTCQGEVVNSSTFQGEGVNSSTCQGKRVQGSTFDEIIPQPKKRRILQRETVLEGGEEEGEEDESVTFSQSDTVESQTSEWVCSQDQELSKRSRLDDFLETCELSPVKKHLSSAWSGASSKTKAYYLNKTENIFQEVMQILAPGQEEELKEAFLQKQGIETQPLDLSIISSSYSQTSDWGTQRQILSLVAPHYQLQTLQHFIPDLTKYKYTSARKHSASVGSGLPVSYAPRNKEGISSEQVSHFLDFVLSPAIMIDIPYGENKLKLSSGETMQVPKVIINSVRSRVVELYQHFCSETEYSRAPSFRSCMRMLSAIEPSVRKSMKGLDNYAAEGAKAVDDLKDVAETLGAINKGQDWATGMKQSLSTGKQYLKLEYKVHVSKESEVADHCCQWALSDQSSEFTVKCGHNHQKSCDSCQGLRTALNSITTAAKEVQYESEDQRDDVTYTVEESVRAVDEWIKHILRTVNQDRARSDIISSLKEYEVLLERDWAMKFIPMLYREPQSKWFGKRGLNWHISVGTYKENDQLTSVTVVHVFDAAAQDARTSNAILKHTLSKLHELNPALTKAFVRSDNAGCFHGSESICSVPVINQFSKVKIEQIDFADPQGGKSICDRRAAHIKSSVRKYVNEGHNVRTAAEFMTAVSGCKLKSISVVVALPPPASKMSSATIPKITTLNNFKFNDKHMKVFRQYEIGKGKKCSYQPFPCADLTIIDSFDRKNTTVFANMTGNIGNDGQEISQGITCTSDDNIDTDVSGGDHDSETSLFTCPDPNCISCFSKYGNLLKHLDIGTHRMKIQKSSLADKSKIQFALQMDNKVVSQPFARAETSNGLCTILKTGWAHKTRRPSKPFSPEQTEFLKEKFGKGEATGCKSDPEEVATVMRSVRTETGARRFSKKEFLTANQIAGFFSRLSVEKRKKFIASYEDEDLEAEIEADCVQELGKLAANCR